MFDSIWHYQVRLFPLIIGLSIFAILHALRRITKIEYTPSYFAIFPSSKLDYQLSEYFGEFFEGKCISVEDGRKRNPKLYLKSMISFFLTFFFVPLLVGLFISFFILPTELSGFLLILLVWQALNCAKATWNFSFYRGAAPNTWVFFSSFYGVYLLSLFFVIRLGYRYAQPFALNRDVPGLLSTLEDRLVPIVINIVVIGVLSNLFAHWLINKDALKPGDQQEANQGVRHYDKQEL